MGEFISTSDRMGYGMKQSKNCLSRCSLGICMTSYNIDDLNEMGVYDLLTYDNKGMGTLSAIDEDNLEIQELFHTRDLEDGVRAVLLPIRLLV